MLGVVFTSVIKGVPDLYFRPNPVPTFSTVAAAHRKWSSDGGNRLGDPQAVLILTENTSDIRGTVADKYFRFAAAKVENS